MPSKQNILKHMTFDIETYEFFTRRNVHKLENHYLFKCANIVVLYTTNKTKTN